MFKHKFLIFIILIIALLSIGVAGAAESSVNENSTEVVTSSYDENTFLEVVSEDTYSEDTTLSNKSFTQLNNTINSASDIKLDSNYKMAESEAVNFTNGITISKDISINGNGFTIDANNLGRIFSITGNSTVSLTNITLANGNSGEGGAIYNENSKLTLTNLTFINNTAEDGGAIYNGGNNFIVNGSVFINNAATSYGGAIVNRYYVNGFSIVNSAFINNTGETAGAIYNAANNVSIINSIFTNNSANFSGAVANYGSNFIITNSSFNNNIANSSGGAIRNSGVAFTVNKCNFNNNKAGFDGGAIDNDCANNFIISNSSFNNNIANFGGAIINYCGANSIIINSAFNNNSGDIGGAIYNCVAINFTVDNSSFINNTVSSVAGAIYNDGVNLVLNNTIFINNTASYNGGVIWNNETGVNFTVDNSIFINNLANIGAGAIYNGADNFIINNSEFTNNTAVVYGGGAIWNWESMNFTISNSNFTNNDVMDHTEEGGVIFNYRGSNFTVSGCSFNNNDVDAIWNSAVNFTVDNCSFNNNAGVAIKNSGDMNFIVSNSNFTNNTGKSGGAIYNTAVNSTISNSNFINNSAVTYGGAIWNSAAGFTISDSSFTNNIANSGGGAVYNSGGANFTLNNSNFNNNVANYYGGAIMNLGTGCIVDNSSLINNTAYSGGAIYNLEDAFSITNSNLINNTATQAVIYNYGTFALANNKYSGISEGKTYICNQGVILTPVTITVLENKTINTKNGESVVLFATIDCDGASVAGGLLNFTIANNTYSGISNDDGIYNCTYKVAFDNCKVVSAFYDNATNVDVKTGILNARYDANLTADNVVMIYHDGTRLIANLLDANRNPIANTTISFTINGVTYNRTTDANGSVSLAINLDYGLYNAVISYGGNETYNPAGVNASVEVKSSVIGQNLVKMWMNDTQFYGLFINSNGNPLANKNVTFNINGVFYTRTTDMNGTARLNINLNPRNYILTVINPITGEERGFNVLVKSLIEASDLTKYYQNTSQFEAKIYNKDGLLAINKEVNFNINGVVYTRTTDSNGTVKLAINLRPGNYTITTVYDGLAIGNNVEVLPTLITSDLTMSYHDGSKFQAKTLDAQGNLLDNQDVTFNVNGVFYHITTGSDGVASLNINLNKGEYIITSMWNNYQVGNKITIF